MCISVCLPSAAMVAHAVDGNARSLTISGVSGGDSVLFVGKGLLEEIPKVILDSGLCPGVFVILSDKTVFALYGERLLAAFLAATAATAGAAAPRPPCRILSYAIEPGEASKCREVKAAVEDFMLEHRCVRDTVVVALGGGVVGDLAGFVAATYMRGVPVIQVPTSAMAMIDSSVGGKTAINVPAGKNLIGAFHQPRFVFADMHLLRSLGRRELVEGLAEAVKMGIIRDADLFSMLEGQADRISKSADEELMTHVIYESLRHKADVVALDEKECGVRSTLNFGHTIGHAIEALLSPRLLHGECVSIGCVLEADLACRLNYISVECVDRIRACLASYGLPVALPELPDGKGISDLLQKMAVDKKCLAGSIRCTIITGIGSSLDEPVAVSQDAVQAVLSRAWHASGLKTGEFDESRDASAKRPRLA